MNATKVRRLHEVEDDPLQSVRTTGRIKKPKAVFDPSDSHVSRTRQLPTEFVPIPSIAPSSGVTTKAIIQRRRSIACMKASELSRDKSNDDRVLDEKNKLASQAATSRPITTSNNKTASIMIQRNPQQPIAIKSQQTSQSRRTITTVSHSNKVFAAQTPQIAMPRPLISNNGNNKTLSSLIQRKSPQYLATKPQQTVQTQRVNMSKTANANSGKSAVVQERKRPISMGLRNVDNGNRSNAQVHTLDANKKSRPNAFKDTVDNLPTRNEVNTWSVDRVAAYISKYFPNESVIFKEQDIDGNALLMLSRNDIVQTLPFKLGPSLRLYNLILKIQTQTVDAAAFG